MQLACYQHKTLKSSFAVSFGNEINLKLQRRNINVMVEQISEKFRKSLQVGLQFFGQ